MPQVLQVNSDLMGSSGLESTLEQRHLPSLGIAGDSMGTQAQVVPVSDGMLSSFHYGKADAVPTMAAQGGIHGARCPRRAVHQRQVAPVGGVGRKLRRQMSMSPGSSCHYDDSAGSPVQPVHNSRPQPLASWRILQLVSERFKQVQDRVDQRAIGVPWSWMYDQAGGLVHDQEMVIQVKKLNRDILRLEVSSRSSGSRNSNGLAALKSPARANGLTIHAHFSCDNHGLESAA